MDESLSIFSHENIEKNVLRSDSFIGRNPVTFTESIFGKRKKLNSI